MLMSPLGVLVSDVAHEVTKSQVKGEIVKNDHPTSMGYPIHVQLTLEYFSKLKISYFKMLRVMGT